MTAKADLAPDVERAADEPETLNQGILDEFIAFRLRRIEKHLSRSFVERASSRGVRQGAFSALALIDANPGLSQITLSRQIGFDKATVVSLLDYLEKHGWATRLRSTVDRRRHTLFLTDAGREVLEELCRVGRENEQQVRNALSPGEHAQLSSLLERLERGLTTAES
jgi:DNA-binding MarR family transcriptional regulator